MGEAGVKPGLPTYDAVLKACARAKEPPQPPPGEKEQ